MIHTVSHVQLGLAISIIHVSNAKNQHSISTLPPPVNLVLKAVLIVQVLLTVNNVKMGTDILSIRCVSVVLNLLFS